MSHFFVVLGFLAMIGDEMGLALSFFILAWFFKESP
jgi:hypothetical protein